MSDKVHLFQARQGCQTRAFEFEMRLPFAIQDDPVDVEADVSDQGFLMREPFLENRRQDGRVFEAEGVCGPEYWEGFGVDLTAGA